MFRWSPTWPNRPVLLTLIICGLLLADGGQGVGRALAQPPPGAAIALRIASFNIQFLGLFQNRDDEALAELLEPFDLVFIQELVAPPYPGKFPDNTSYRPDPDAAEFFDAMRRRGFEWVLSEEDTGTTPQRHVNSSATEWFVAFYRRAKVVPAPDLVTGFLAEDRYDHPNFERVPYAFGFRAASEDLVFISVHLMPGAGAAPTRRRAEEIATIASWISARQGNERDYVILGDMNIEHCRELAAVLPAQFESLNRTCLPTNTNVNGPKPYDHVMLSAAHTQSEIPSEFSVINLVEKMRPKWPASRGPYPGDPYRHDQFRQVYSDHSPVVFQVVIDGVDDD